MLTNAYGQGGWVDLKFIIAYECIWCTWIGGIQNLESLRKFTGGMGFVGLVKSLAYELCKQYLEY